ncbi:non-specific lipid-transfer protein D, cotyledon-specific isoform-like [Vigna unguiculata]|uniref:non-specific lipid-transfer protein D, cotyledon-specific isoform-like n=1 Tax=Vigna unguiculata TaxID=3917 RepID=UPI00101636CB|nr:non-specific lipid-transfer protein D, cotyledon-specific isoform-like [Vigna unguiculata]
MVEKRVLALVMFVMAYGLAITRLSEGQMPATCDEYKPLFAPCVPYLVSQEFSTPTPSCCAGAAQQLTKGNNPAALKNLCTCLDASTANLGFHFQKFIQLPTACKIKLSYSIEKCVHS